MLRLIGVFVVVSCLAQPALAEVLIASSGSGEIQVWSASDGPGWCEAGVRLHVRVTEEGLLTRANLQRGVEMVASLGELDCSQLESMVVLGFVGSEAKPRMSSSAFKASGWELLGADPDAGVAAVPASLSPADRELLAGLETLSWVPAGPQSDRHVYVISAPWCGYCQRLYRNTKGLEGVQFRWIKTGARDEKHRRQIAAASLSRDPAALEAIYAGGRLPKIRDRKAGERLVAIHERVLGILSRDIEARTGGWGFPTLIYATAEGLQVTGASADPVSQVADVVPLPGSKDVAPIAYRVALSEFPTEKLRSGMVLGTGDTPVYLLPDVGAPVVHRLAKNRGFKAASKLRVDGQDWYAVRLYEDGTPGYVRARESEYRPE